jgi:hypothetical protein
MPSDKPRWRRPQLSIRALMIGVAALALALPSYWFYLPWLRWRVRVERIIADKFVAPGKEGGLFFDPTYQKYNGLTGPEYQDVDVKNAEDPRPELLELRTQPVYINFPWPTLIDGMKP